MFCCECGHEMVLRHGPMAESYRGEEITVEDVERWECPHCGNDVMDTAEASRVSRELANRYAHVHGLMSPDEILALRKSLRLNQAEFEELLGVSRPAACRWERGSVIQTKTADLLMRVVRDVPGAGAYLSGLTGVNVRSRVVQPAGGKRDWWSTRDAEKAGAKAVDVEKIKTEEIGLAA